MTFEPKPDAPPDEGAAAIVTIADHPPSSNRIWRWTARGPHRSVEYTTWLDAMSWYVAAQREKPVSGPFAAHIFVRKPARACDLDNYIKPTLDLLQKAGVISNDKHAQKVTAEFCRGSAWALKIFITSTAER